MSQLARPRRHTYTDFMSAKSASVFPLIAPAKTQGCQFLLSAQRLNAIEQTPS